MGSLRKIRPVVQGWALLASPVSPEVALFLFLKGCPYLEHSQGGGVARPLQARPDLGLWPSSRPSCSEAIQVHQAPRSGSFLCRG